MPVSFSIDYHSQEKIFYILLNQCCAMKEFATHSVYIAPIHTAAEEWGIESSQPVFKGHSTA